MKIKLVSFDADGTIVDNGYVNKFWFEELPKLYAKKTGKPFDEARSALRSYYDEIGDEDLRWYKPSYWFDRFDLDEDPKRVIERIQKPENLRLYEDALDLTANLEGKYILVVTSNSPRIFLDYALRRIEDRFHGIYSCVSDFGEVKKHVGVYQKVLNRVGVSPDCSVHIGDHREFDYRIPKRLGMTAFYIERSGGEIAKEDGIITDLREVENKIAKS
mgnify:CR=1 FL=1